MENKNKNQVYLNNVVYDLTQITNPHLKKAMRQRSENQRFMFAGILWEKHKDYNDHCDYRNGEDHTDRGGHTDHGPDWEEHSEKYSDVHSEYNDNRQYEDWG